MSFERKTVIAAELNGRRSNGFDKAMTPTTQTVREQAFLPLEGDIPEGMTIAHYRSGRDRREPTGPRARRRRMPRLRRRSA